MIFYILRGEAYRSKGVTENTIKLYEEFRNNSPIIARENCFRFYQNYIDVFLDSKEKKCTSHEQAEIDLQDFFNSHQKKHSKWGEVDADFGICIQISFVFNDTITHTLRNGIKVYEGEEVIHGIHNRKEDLKEIYFENLLFEYSLYKNMGYEVKNYRKDFDISDVFEEKKIENILATPIDFEKWLNEIS